MSNGSQKLAHCSFCVRALKHTLTPIKEDRFFRNETCRLQIKSKYRAHFGGTWAFFSSTPADEMAHAFLFMLNTSTSTRLHISALWRELKALDKVGFFHVFIYSNAPIAHQTFYARIRQLNLQCGMTFTEHSAVSPFFFFIQLVKTRSAIAKTILQKYQPLFNWKCLPLCIKFGRNFSHICNFNAQN